jgi:hypothetical protein
MPEQRDRRTVVRFDGGGNVTELPLDERIVSGNPGISIADMRPVLAAFEKYCADGARSRCNK